MISDLWDLIPPITEWRSKSCVVILMQECKNDIVDSQFWIVAYFEKNGVCTHCICVGFTSGTVYTARVRWSGPSQLLTGVNSLLVMEYLTAS